MSNEAFKPLGRKFSGNARILVICLRRIGDVLLCTPLLRSLRRAYPQCQLDVLVYASTGAILHGNPDINQVIEVDARGGGLAAAKRVFRRYDLAISAVHNDRPVLLAFCAAPVRVGVVLIVTESGGRWKRWLLHGWSQYDLQQCHTVVQYLRLADSLGIERSNEVVLPQIDKTPKLDGSLGAAWRKRRYAVIHPAPMYRYKSWPLAAWKELIGYLQGLGLEVCVSGGHAQAEREFVRKIIEGCGPSLNDYSGQLEFAELAELISHAQVFIGPDTSVTHLAAATGIPTLALFGPSDPIAWGPWPQNYSDARPTPWGKVAALQHHKNVWIIQGIKPCVPCLQEGCERNRESRADCLDELPVTRVIAVVDQALAARKSA